MRNVRFQSTQLKSGQEGAVSPINLILLLIVFVVSWLLWSGVYKPLVLGLGAFSCLLTLFLATRMGFFANTSELKTMLRRLPAYWLWLLKDIVVSSWKVSKLVVNPKSKIEPKMVVLDASDLGEMGQTILGNSITLSPGTVTVDIYEGQLLVHCILKEDAEALQQGELTDRIRALRNL